MNNLSKDSKCFILIGLIIFCLITFTTAKKSIDDKVYNNTEKKKCNDTVNYLKTNMDLFPKNSHLNEISKWCMYITDNYKNNL